MTESSDTHSLPKHMHRKRVTEHPVGEKIRRAQAQSTKSRSKKKKITLAQPNWVTTSPKLGE